MSRPGDLDELPYTWALTSVIAEICDRAGIPYDRINVDGLDAGVDGFWLTANNDAYTGIEALGGIFLFDAANFDGRINFVPRGGSVVADIDPDNLVDDGNDREILKAERRDSMSVPRVLRLEYFDIDGGLTTNKQTSDRSLDSRAKSEVGKKTTVILRTQDAARSVTITHKLTIEEQRGEFSFSLPIEYIQLTCADIVTIDGERIRVTEVEIDEGQQNYKAVYDRLSAYTSTIVGVPITPPATPPDLVVGDTVLHFIDCHILRDADDRLGYYVAISGTTETWTGASIELSTDGGANYTDSFDSVADSVVGVLTAVLPVHPADYPDAINTLSVELARDDDELLSTDLTGMLNRTNLAIVGNELINFADVDETSPGHWDLSYLLRGRKGTTAVSHSIGERFIWLDRQSLFFIDSSITDIGKTLTFRVTSYGAETPVVSSGTFTGKSQIERQPSYLAAVRSGGNIIITWQGVGRLGGGATVRMGQYFIGFRVSVNGTEQVTLLQSLTVVDPGGSVTIEVCQLNNLTGAGPLATVVI